MVKIKKKDWTTVQIYKNDLKYLNSISSKGDFFRDKIKEILSEYKKCKQKTK